MALWQSPSIWAKEKTESHPLDAVPEHFIRNGHFSTSLQGAWSPAVRLIRDDLVVPLASVAATSFVIGFVHKFLADRLKSNWVSALGWPLLNMTWHFFMRPGFDRYTALRLLPDVGDAAMTLARGDQWAGSFTHWLRMANTVYAGLEAIWPELATEASAFYQCRTQPIVIDGMQSPVSLTVLTCPDDWQNAGHKPTLFIDFLSSGQRSCEQPEMASALMGSLYQLRDTAADKDITQLLLSYEKNTDGQMQLKVFPRSMSRWQEPYIFNIESQESGQWWSDIDFAEVQGNQRVIPPLSPFLLKGIESALYQPSYESQSIAIEPGRLHSVAGLFRLPQETATFWFRPQAGSLLPGSYPPLPDIVLSSNTQLPSEKSQIAAFQKHSLIPDTMRLPWKITRLGLMSLVRNRSIKAAEKMAAVTEQFLVMPGLLLGQGYLDRIIPHHWQVHTFEAPDTMTLQKVTVQTESGERLEGLLVSSGDPKDAGHRTLHIHYHGNAESRDTAAEALFKELTPDGKPLGDFCKENNIDVLFPEYRGFRNDLKPVDGQTLLDDANRFYKTFKDQYKRVTVSGWSLGAGMAAWVASQNKPDALILLSAYTDLARVAKDKLQGIPIPKWLMKFNMETDQYITKISTKTNIYLLHGNKDSVIDSQNTMDLSSLLIRAGHPNTHTETYTDRTHQDIWSDARVSRWYKNILMGD